MTQLAAAMAVYLALIAGLALHGFDVPDPTQTSSVGKQFTGVSARRAGQARQAIGVAASPAPSD